jgi:hypothetical protein
LVENQGYTQTCPCYDDDADDDDDVDDDDGEDDEGDGDGEDFATPGTIFSNKPIHLHSISMGVLTFSLDEGTTHYY